ncbi:MAG: histidine decarboxylase, pyruvoyl type [Candidatus Omnitrophota bacterium]
MKKLLLAFMLLIFLSSSAVGEDKKTVLKPETGSLNEGLTIEDVVNGAVGPFDSYSDGYGNPGASGLGYISVLTLEIGTVTSDMDEVLEEIVAFDRAEAGGTYIGQINMITASSFNGINGAVWGYHIAKAETIANNTLQPLFMKKRSDGTEIPVYPVEPLLDAGKRLFGTDSQRRFPLLPGAHVRSAVKSKTVKGPTFVWSAIALAIAEDRNTAANLFIEDAGHSISLQSEEDRTMFLDRLYRNIAESVIRCGDDQKVQYKEIFVGGKIEWIPEGHVGSALTCAPYVVLARKVVPVGEKPEVLLNLTLSEWEKTIGLSPLKENPDTS